MADELTISIAASFSKSGLAADLADMGFLGLPIDVSGSDYIRGTQSIGTSAAEVLGKGEITTPGFLFIRNTDATNYVELERATFVSGNGSIKLKPGDPAAFRVNSTNLYALANTGACVVTYLWFED